MNKDLIIISHNVKSEKFMNKFKSSVDILALTPASMFSLDKLKIPYKTTDDYYNTEIYREDINRINKKIEKIFKRLDKVCEEYVGFEYSYSGNILYFLSILADLMYLDGVCQKIQKTYKNVYLLSDIKSKNILWDNLTYND